MLIKLVKVKRSSVGSYSSLQEVYVNINTIGSVTSENEVISLHEKNSIGIQESTELSKVVIMEGNRTRSIIVVGSPNEIYNKINKKQILRG